MLYYIIDLGLEKTDKDYLRIVEEEVFEQELNYNVEEMTENGEMSEEEADEIFEKFNSLEKGEYETILNDFTYGKTDKDEETLLEEHEVKAPVDEVVETEPEEETEIEEEIPEEEVEEEVEEEPVEEKKTEFSFEKKDYVLEESFDDYGRWQIISASDKNDEEAPLVYFIVETGTLNIAANPFDTLEEAEEDLANDPYYNDEVIEEEYDEEDDDDYIDISEEEENEVDEE